jgi:flagellar basal body-associated protein FliL
MDPNISNQGEIQTTQSTQAEILAQQPLPPKKSNKKIVFWVFAILLFLIAFVVGGFFTGAKQNKIISQNQQKQIVSPTPLSAEASAKVDDPTANWKILDIGSQLFIKYPPTWKEKVQENSTYVKDNVYEIYNSQKMESVVQNGGSYASLPTEYLYITFPKDSSQTAEQVAKDFQKAWLAQNTAITIKTKNIGGLNFALYTNAGEGSGGNNLAISNGKLLIEMVTSLKDLNGNEIENQILSTLRLYTVDDWQQYQSGQSISGISIQYPRDLKANFAKAYNLSADYNAKYRLEFDFAPIGWNGSHSTSWMGWGSIYFDVFDPETDINQWVNKYYSSYKDSFTIKEDVSIGNKQTFLLEASGGTMWASRVVILGSDYSYEMSFPENTSNFLQRKDEIFSGLHIN